MAGKKLVSSVHVHEDGETTVYQAGDVPPPKHGKLITNPSAWGDDEPADAGPVPDES